MYCGHSTQYSHLVLYLCLLLLHFGHEQRTQWFVIALVNVPVEAFCWRQLTADERKHDVKMTSRMTEQHMYGKPDRKQKAKWNLFFRNFLRENENNFLF